MSEHETPFEPKAPSVLAVDVRIVRLATAST